MTFSFYLYLTTVCIILYGVSNEHPTLVLQTVFKTLHCVLFDDCHSIWYLCTCLSVCSLCAVCFVVRTGVGSPLLFSHLRLWIDQLSGTSTRCPSMQHPPPETHFFLGYITQTNRGLSVSSFYLLRDVGHIHMMSRLQKRHFFADYNHICLETCN